MLTCMDISHLPLASNNGSTTPAKTIVKIERQWEQAIEHEEKAKMVKQLTDFKQKLEDLQQENVALKQENQQFKKIILAIQSKKLSLEESLALAEANSVQPFFLKQ